MLIPWILPRKADQPLGGVPVCACSLSGGCHNLVQSSYWPLEPVGAKFLAVTKILEGTWGRRAPRKGQSLPKRSTPLGLPSLCLHIADVALVPGLCEVLGPQDGRRGDGWVGIRAKKVTVPKMGFSFLVLCSKFHFPAEENSWFWVGGWFGPSGWVRQITPHPPWISTCLVGPAAYHCASLRVSPRNPYLVRSHPLIPAHSTYRSAQSIA